MNLPPLIPPTSKPPVRELLTQAEHDVEEWSFDQEGKPLANPNTNSFRNTKWAFVGKPTEAVVLCIWFDDIETIDGLHVHVSNGRQYRQRLIDRDRGEKKDNVRSKLRAWTNRSKEFDDALYTALSDNKPIRPIMVAGNRGDKDAGAFETSTVDARSLDSTAWYVQSYDQDSGEYRIVRGLKSNKIRDGEGIELEDGVTSDPAFLDFISKLSDTERDAMIKVRVGQSRFRDALINRWGGCSVFGCKERDLLIASHIRPWSKCENPKDRINVANGLLLTPNLDRLFDSGLITFDQKFRIKISTKLKDGILNQLNVTRDLRLKSTEHSDILPFLAWHEINVFRT
ncbi:HNH endonuclease [Paraburkholderia agricolaris]|uniref:HNH endonuclease n=1 Tax=Paraburkholderia agricolaris TaxID=2152888 RepID=UPI0012909B23|nr:HNH endonuclease signature motif containing protein [Paraburkholderia agricolaris]